MKELGIYVGGGSKGVVSGNTCVRDLSPAYIFCCSLAPDADWLERKEGQDVCYCIKNIHRFAERIRAASKGMLGRHVIRPVSYVPRQGDPFRSPPLVGAFFKNPERASENELRIVWEAKRIEAPRVQIEVPDAASLIEPCEVS